MYPEFSKIYAEVLNQYRRYDSGPYWQEDYQLISQVENLIDESIAEMNFEYHLRPDAKLFLLINLHQVVVLPLAHPSSPTKFDTKVETGIKKDIKDILRASVVFLNERDLSRRDLAASHVLWGTAKVLDSLSLKSWRIWERKDENSDE